MSGNPSNAAVWANADVYIGGLTANVPSGGDPFDETWDLVGLLNGDDGFTEGINTDQSDFYAWGGILFATSRRNFKLTRQFTAYEENATVMDLWFPGNTLVWDTDGGYEGDIAVPDLQAKFMVAFETRTGSVIKRVITKNYAQVDNRADVKQGENDAESRQLTVAIYPNAAGALWHTYKGAQIGVSSLDVSPATSSKAAGQTTQLAVTATLADTHTETVTHLAAYMSSAPSKATVDENGLVHFVATGTATITASYGGQTDTCAVTVT